MKNSSLHLLFIFLAGFYLSSCQQEQAFYSVDDFEKIQKIDAHFHYNVIDPEFLQFAELHSFKIVTPNTRTIDDDQFEVSSSLHKLYPDKLAFFGTFSAEIWDQPFFVDSTIKRIEMVLNEGACGIKMWKNIGMIIQDTSGRYIMIDDPLFTPIFDYLEKHQINVLGHFGEPRNCWLPREEMTVRSNRDYYEKNPQYHMYLHPDAPSYEDHLRARDQVLQKHPDLKFIGAHMASIEWDVTELGRWLDRFPKTKVDMAGRINHLQYQSLENRELVRNFIIKYQDRILYATDRSIRPYHPDVEIIKSKVLEKWKTEWLFLATDSVFISNQVNDQEVRGLSLPREVIDKIYRSNAEYLFTQNY